MTATLQADCTCGHARGRHMNDDGNPCAVIECGCREYQPATVLPAPKVCLCRHPKRAHEREGFAPQCTDRGCHCLRYRETHRPAADAVVPIQPAAPTPRVFDPAARDLPPTVEQVLTAAARSGRKRTVTAGEKITTLIGDLRGRLADERVAAEQARVDAHVREQIRAEIARAEEQLAAAKAKLHGPARTPPGENSGEHPCPDCGKTFATAQAIGVHRAKAHGYRVAGAS